MKGKAIGTLIKKTIYPNCGKRKGGNIVKELL